MTARYAIADYLTDAEKQAMCAAQYADPRGGGGPGRCVATGCSPLGLVVRLHRAADGSNLAPRAPDACAVAHELHLMGRGSAHRIMPAARAFIARWNARVLTPADLPAALGLGGNGEAL